MHRFMLAFAVLLFGCIEAKVFDRCGLARELLDRGIPQNQVGDFVCLAEAESGLDTASKNEFNGDGTQDFGLFQINSGYWCIGPNSGENPGCGRINCDVFLNDDIRDDVECAKRILQDPNGFGAWYGWKNKCAGKDVGSYVAGCF